MKRYYQSKARFFQLFLILTGIFYSNITCAQEKLPNSAVQVVGGYSKHGSGDMNGIVFGTEYIRYLTRRFSLNYNMRATINDDRDLIIVNNNISGTRTDASIRFTTAGVQLGVNGQFSIIRNKRHEFLTGLGGFGRYQSASNGTDGYSIYYPWQTGQPTVLVGYDNGSPQETFSFGGIFQIQYSIIFNKIYLGFLPAFQTDTNGDVVAQAALSIGRKF